MEDPMLKMQSPYTGRADKARPDGGGSFGPLVWSGGYELDGSGCGYSGGYFCQPSERTSRTRLWPDCGQDVPHTPSLWPGCATNCSSSAYSSYSSYKEESPLHSLPYSAASLSEQTGAFCQFPLQPTPSTGTNKKYSYFIRMKMFSMFLINFNHSSTRFAY